MTACRNRSTMGCWAIPRKPTYGRVKSFVFHRRFHNAESSGFHRRLHNRVLGFLFLAYEFHDCQPTCWARLYPSEQARVLRMNYPRNHIKDYAQRLDPVSFKTNWLSVRMFNSSVILDWTAGFRKGVGRSQFPYHFPLTWSLCNGSPGFFDVQTSPPVGIQDFRLSNMKALWNRLWNTNDFWLILECEIVCEIQTIPLQFYLRAIRPTAAKN